MNRRAVAHAAGIGVLAGLAGGFAEVIWIWAYAAVTKNDASLVARAVTAAVRLNQDTFPVASGIAIHMGLAATLGVVVALAMRSVAGVQQGLALYATVSAALLIVWAINFCVVLPLVSPEFVDVVPYAVSPLSKLLFGIAAASTFQLAWLSPAPRQPG